MSEEKKEEKEEEKPCIKDRLRAISKDIIDFFNIICLTIVIFMFIVLPEILPILYGREVIIPIFSQISLEGRFTIVFSLSVILFTSAQYRSERKRNKIEDLRHELENVYGPLFTLLSLYEDTLTATNEPSMSISMGSSLNEIFQKYPHVLSSKLYDYWKETINTRPPILNGENVYYVHSRFVQDFFAEYIEKVKSYRKLVGKE